MSTLKISLLLPFLIISTFLVAQQAPMLGNVKMSYFNSISSKKYLNNKGLKFVDVALKTVDTTTSRIKFSPNSIMPTYYTEHLGLMCKEELKLEKIIKFPVKIRLGSKEQVDYLEGKFKHY